MECARGVGAKCAWHAPRLPRNSQEGPKLFPLEPKRAQTSSERKLLHPTGRHSGLEPKKRRCGPKTHKTHKTQEWYEKSLRLRASEYPPREAEWWNSARPLSRSCTEESTMTTVAVRAYLSPSLV